MLEKLFSSRSMGRESTNILSMELDKGWGSLFQIFGQNNVKALQAESNTALLFDTVYACINVLSDDIAKLPFKCYRSVDRNIQVVTDSYAHKLLRLKPNRYMNPFNFIKLMMTDVCTYGNFYAYIKLGKDGKPEELLPMKASLTRPLISTDGELFYQTTYMGKPVALYPSEVIHIKGMSKNGIEGLSPIASVRVQLESNDAAARYNRELIEGGGSPQGILKASGQVSPEAKDLMRAEWRKVNEGQPIGIIDSGLDYQQIGISQADMQWLDAQKYNAQRIAAIFKVPLHKINDLGNATYTNIEHQSLDYVKNTLQPWVTQIESEFNLKLFTDEYRTKGYYVKFNMDSELRGDSEARAKVHALNMQYGINTINEVRAMNELPPYELDVADSPFMTLNLAPAKNIEAYQNNKFGEALNGKGKGGDDIEEQKV